MMQGATSEASDALIWLRGDSYDPRQELTVLKKTLQAEKTNSEEQITLRELISVGKYWKPFLISCILFGFLTWSGINAVVLYVQVIFLDSGVDMDPGLVSFLVGLGEVIGSLVLIPIVDRVGRKIILGTSTAIMAVSIFALAIFFHLKQKVAESGCLSTEVRMSNIPSFFVLRLTLFFLFLAGGQCYYRL